MKLQKKKNNPVIHYGLVKRAFDGDFKKVEVSYYQPSLDKYQGRLTEYHATSVFQTPSEQDISDWLAQAVDMVIDFDAAFDHRGHHHFTDSNFPVSYKKLLSDFQEALWEYLEFQKSTDGVPTPSEPSVRSFLFLIPSLALFDPDISIDSANGCVNLSIHRGKFGVLTSLIGSDGRVYYSFAGRSERIFKITGTAKFKTARDHMQFSRVLNLL
jgi:hypothetical protein